MQINKSYFRERFWPNFQDETSLSGIELYTKIAGDSYLARDMDKSRKLGTIRLKNSFKSHISSPCLYVNSLRRMTQSHLNR